MKVKEKILFDINGLTEHGPINIVILGDSISHASFKTNNDWESVYWNVLRKKLNQFRDYIPVNMICAAIGGTTATQSLPRLETQVFCHRPDLVIVCFGLNDVNLPLEEYLDSLKQIFDKCKEYGCDAIFMTPNMFNTYVADDVEEKLADYAYAMAEVQNSGRMDKYMAAATALATEMEISVCDCYSKWKELAKTEDTTMLLANRINHPTEQMHKLFANALYEVIMGDTINDAADCSTMYKDV